MNVTGAGVCAVLDAFLYPPSRPVEDFYPCRSALPVEMAWVKSEYAGELAVLATWIVALLPWSVSSLSIRFLDRPVQVVVVRFVYVRFQYIFGISFGDQERILLWFFDAPAYNPPELSLGSWLWVLGALVFTVPLALSVVYYLAEARLEERLPVDPVRLQGGLLAVAGAVLTAAAVAVWTGQQTTIPIGGPFALLFGYLLLTVDRT